MRAGIRITGVLIAYLALAPWSFAEEESQITIGIASYERLRDDLKFFVEQAPGTLPKQWSTLKDILDSFAQGVDPKKPMTFDVILGKKEASYGGFIPIEKMDGNGGFIQNLAGFGFNAGKPDASGLRKIEQAKAATRRPAAGKKAAPAAAPGPSRTFYLKPAGAYAVLAPTAAALGNLPANPATGISEWLKGEVDVAGRITNTAKNMTGRRANFKELRKELEAAVPYKRGERQADADLKRLSVEQNLSEAERFLVESQELLIAWTTLPSKSGAFGDLTLTALPETSLAKSIAELAQQPSYFAHVEFQPQPVLQARINFPIDDLRSKHASELYPALLPVMQTDIDERPNLTPAGKKAAREALSLLFDMLTEAIPLKVLDGFVDLHRGSSNHGVVVGIRAADGTKATAAFQQMTKIRDGWKLAEGVTDFEGVTIHELTVSPHRLQEFQSLFKGETTVLIGVSKDAVWGAAGEDAMKKLQAAITQTKKDPPAKVDPVVASVDVRFEPFVQILDIIRTKQPPPKATDKAEIEAEKERTRVRKYAQQAFEPGDDRLTATLKRDGETVHGHLEIMPGVQRFIGTLIADFTAQNLQ